MHHKVVKRKKLKISLDGHGTSSLSFSRRLWGGMKEKKHGDEFHAKSVLKRRENKSIIYSLICS